MAVNEEILLDIKVQNTDALTNIAKLTAANKELKDQLDGLKKSYNDGSDQTDANAKQQAVLTAQIKENTAGIRENSKEIKTNAASVASAADSINGMRARVADLNVAWNSMSAAAREGDAGKAIQKEMASLNESVNSASKSVNNFKDNVGNYPDAMNAVGLSNTKVGKSMDTLGITADMGMKQMASAVTGGVKASLAALKSLLMNPVIAFLVAISAAAMLVYKAFTRNEESTAKLNKITGALSGVFNGLLKILEPVANFLTDKLVVGFELASAAIDGTIKLISKGLKAIGLDSASKSVANFGESMSKASKQGKELADSEFKLQQSQRESRKIQLEYQNQAEKLRQMRDNDKLSFKERMDANNQLGIVLKKQSADELRIANLGIEIAQKKIALNGRSKESLDELAAKETEVIDIKERITGQESEQLVNINSLRRDAAAKNKELAAKRIELAIKTAENLLKIEQASRAELDKTQLTDPKYFKERIALLEKDAAAEKEINKLKFKNENELKAENLASDKKLAADKLDLSKGLAEQSIKELDYELQLSKIQNETLLAGQKLTNEQLHKNRIAEIESTNKEELTKLLIQKDAKILTESEYTDAVKLKNAEKNLKIAQDNADFEASEKERKLQAQSDNYANELSLLQENSDRAIEIKKAQLDAQMQIELTTAEKTGASTKLIKAKYEKAEKLVDKQAADSKLDQAKRITDGIMNLFGKTTKAGKAAASASVAIDTYKGAQAAITGMAGAGPVGWALGAIEAGVIIAGGAKSISDIWAVNENAAASVSSTASTGAPSTTQSSGTTYTNLPTIASMYGSNASQNETAQIIAQSAPAPVVSVTEITNMQNTVQVKENSKL